VGKMEEDEKGGREKSAETPDVIYIHDEGKPFPLHRTAIHGVEVYTTTEEQERELNERFWRLIPPPTPKPKSRWWSWWRRRS